MFIKAYFYSVNTTIKADRLQHLLYFKLEKLLFFKDQFSEMMFLLTQPYLMFLQFHFQ